MDKTWEYDFERQWLYYMEWGRLLFVPTTPDSVFAAAYAKRAGGLTVADGSLMLEAMHSAAIMPLRLASFVYKRSSAESFTVLVEATLVGRQQDKTV